MLATLTPSGRGAASLDVTSRGAPLLWLGTTQSTIALALSAPGEIIGRRGGADGPVGGVLGIPSTTDARRLASIDALHAEERLLREGWIFLCGRARIGDRDRQLCLPLLSQPVRLRRMLGTFSVAAAGDPELTPLVEDLSQAARLEADVELGGGALFDRTNASDALIARLPNLHSWIHAVAAAGGLQVSRVVGPTHDPGALRGESDLVAVVGAGIYATRDINAGDVTSALIDWAGTAGLEGTAFAALYNLRAADEVAPQPNDQVVRSPLPLTEAQRAVVGAARTSAITVVSGPPGCGKSHALAAIAIDAVSRGDSVLVATQSPYAAEVLGDLLDRYPGPTPVLFGSGEHRDTLAARLEAAGLRTGDDEDVALLQRRYDAARADVEVIEHHLDELATRELLAADAGAAEAMAAVYSPRYPRLFDADAQPDAWAHALAQLDDAGTSGPFRRWRTRRRFRRTTGLSAPDPGLPAAIRVAQVRRAAAVLDSTGGTKMAQLFAQLMAADAQLRASLGALLAARAARRMTADKGSRAAVAALSGVLRASRPRRRELLRRLDAPALVGALPLWVGTLADIEHLLPMVPGLFDLVLLDEASQIDQRSAPPALLRARRAVVAGDPRQLRHVSFVADDAVTQAIDDHAARGVAHLLDVRRMSAYDVATSAAGVHWLGDHFRSVPHLIEFSSRRFYEGRLAVLTRQPSTEDADVIEVRHVAGGRDATGVNHAELEEVAAVVARLADAGAHSIGVVTPFRAQADAAEQMLLATFELEQIEAAGLRVGTVHQFQGNERDHVIVSTALTAADPPGSRRFVEDPSLFNVMVTRARHAMTVVASDVPSSGVLAAYLAYADGGPQAPPDEPGADPWIDDLHAELHRCGLAPRRRYPVGRWTVDIAIGGLDAPVALDCRVDAGGAAAHIEKHRQLHAVGWTFLDAYASRFSGDAARAVVTLTAELRAGG